MLEIDHMTAVIIGLVATDVVGLLQEEVIVINFINCYSILVCELCKSLLQPYVLTNSRCWLLCNLFYGCPLLTKKGCGNYQKSFPLIPIIACCSWSCIYSGRTTCMLNRSCVIL